EFVLNRTVSEVDGMLHIENTAAFNIARCNAQTNMLMIHYKTGRPTTMLINNISFADVNDLNFTKCPTSAYACTKDDECDPSNSTIDSEDGKVREFIPGCVPICGVCKSGFVCNKAARCVAIVYHNTRSFSVGPFVLILSLCILLVM
ncbi:hypothetical protein EIN_182690, partial [Entamoeba invadens IP1]|uniref:hypothetical protein n=1 Tax=Entamoeba invadens IP1 TaxID=370355 RepID=UPI0002C3EAE3